jgi:Transposase
LAAASRVVVGGIDTHKDMHVAAVLDTTGIVLGTQSFSTTHAGYRALVRWMRSYGDVRQVGIEGTGSYGAGVTRHLNDAGIEIFEVARPDRGDRRLRGKSDTLDAESAARAEAAPEAGGQAWALRLQGEIAARQAPADVEQAEWSYRDALAIADELSMRPLQAHCHLGLGKLRRRVGRSEEARAELATAVAMLREMGMAFWLPEAETALAEVSQ